VVVFCQECEKAGGTGYFEGKPAHDRHVKDPWNKHRVEDHGKDDTKASWMLFCPFCSDEAASGTPKTGFTTKHRTIFVAENGDEIVKCSSCGQFYRFNLKWTFEKKEVPPVEPKPWPLRKVFIVRPYPSSGDFELYRTEQDAEERILEIEEDALIAAGFEKLDEDEWQSPTGETMSKDTACDSAAREYGIDLPEHPEVANVLD